MNALDKAIGVLSPRWQLQRALYRERLERLYQAAERDPHRKPPRGGNLAADVVIQGANVKLRDWGRHLDENHDLAGAVLDDLVTKTIGSGIALEPRPQYEDGTVDEEFARAIIREWRRWGREADVSGELPFGEVQRLIGRSMWRDGESFVHHINNPRYPWREGEVTYRCECLEADFVPMDTEGSSIQQSEPGLTLVHGIERDGWGRPINYYAYRNHPGSQFYGMRQRGNEMQRIPGWAMVHLRMTRRLGQTRGTSIFANVIRRLDDLYQYEESERIAARVAASMTAYIRRSPDLASEYTSSTATGRRDFEMEPGLVFDNLMPGEDVGTIGTDRPNTALNEFRKGQMQAVAAGTRTSASSVSRNYDGTYSAQRQELVEAGEMHKTIRNYIINVALQPIYERWLAEAIRGGVVEIPRRMQFRGAIMADWRPPGLGWIDPLKEVKAEQIAVQEGFTSRTAVMRRRGEDPHTINTEIEADEFEPRGQSDGQDETVAESDSEAEDPAAARVA